MGIVGVSSSSKGLIIFFIFSSSFFCYGQKYSLGLKASPLIVWPSFGDKEEKEIFSSKVRLGYSVGALVSFPLKHDFDFFAEAGYSTKGRKLEYGEDGHWGNISTYRFLEATMLLRKSYSFMLEKNVPAKWFVSIGPEINYWMSGKGTLTVDGSFGANYEMIFDTTPTANFNYMYVNDANRWLFGLSFGVGLRAPMLANQFLTTELRFVSGHTYLGNSDSSHLEMLTFEDTMKTNLKVLQLVMSYTIEFDRQKQKTGKSTLDKKKKNANPKRRR